MKNFGQLTSANVVAFYEEKENTREPYLGDVLFPSRKQIGMKLDFIKGGSGTPVVLKPSAFDTDVTLRDRPEVDELSVDLPFFKEARLLKEQERQDLLLAEQAGNQAYIDVLMRSIFNDRADLIDGARAQIERMRMQLLSTGQISIKANKVDYTYDYKFPTSNKLELTGTDKWEDLENSDPIADIDNMMAKAAGKGVELMIMTTTTWGNIRKNKNISDYLGKEVRPTTKNIKEYIEEEYKLTVVLYDKIFKTEQGTEKTFFPDDVVSFAPKTLGDTVFGTTPEEADLMAGVGTAAEVELVDLGIAVTTITKDDPVNKITKVSELVMPSFEGANNLFIMNV